MPQTTPGTANRRRTFRRRPRKITKVACFKGALGLGPNLALDLLDVSERGVRLRVKEPLELHQQVEVHLTGLGHRRPVKVPAAVVWCVEAADGSYCIGAHFEKGLPYADLQQLV
jgi:hypothetical protein